MKYLRILLVAILVVLTVSACGGQKKLKGEVYVYVAVPLSGFQANGGQTVLGGARLMAARLNNAGGLQGHKVVVVGMDDESDSDVAVGVAEQIQQAINEGKKVVGVIGHLNSGQTIEAMKLYEGMSLIVVTPTASEVGITQQGYTNFFRVNANDDIQARVDADFLVQTIGAQRVAVIYNDDPYGIGLGKAIAQQLQQRGVEVPLELQVAVEQSTFAQEVPQIQAANPDAIFYAGYEVEAPYLRYELVQAGINVPFMASDGAFLSATIDEAQGTAEGIYVSGFAPSPKEVVDKKWIQEYQAIEARNPGTYSVNGYSALQVLAEGVKRAKSLDAMKVAAAIHDLNIETPAGKIQYDPRGDVQNAQIYIYQVKGDDFVQVASGQ